MFDCLISKTLHTGKIKILWKQDGLISIKI